MIECLSLVGLEPLHLVGEIDVLLFHQQDFFRRAKARVQDYLADGLDSGT
jgi:hypothetical protein